jgi:hypothetical protein
VALAAKSRDTSIQLQVAQKTASPEFWQARRRLYDPVSPSSDLKVRVGESSRICLSTSDWFWLIKGSPAKALVAVATKRQSRLTTEQAATPLVTSQLAVYRNMILSEYGGRWIHTLPDDVCLLAYGSSDDMQLETPLSDAG